MSAFRLELKINFSLTERERPKINDFVNIDKPLIRVEAVCDRVIIIKKGEILIDKKLKELQNKNQQVIKVVFNTTINEDKLQQIPYLLSVDKVNSTSWKLFFKTKEDMRSQIFDFAQENELKILELAAEHKNLESLFRELTLQ